MGRFQQCEAARVLKESGCACTGVVFNTVFPEWLQIVLLTCLLVPVILNTFKKAKKLWDSEQKEFRRRTSVSSPLPTPPRSPDFNILRVRPYFLLQARQAFQVEFCTGNLGLMPWTKGFGSRSRQHQVCYFKARGFSWKVLLKLGAGLRQYEVSMRGSFAMAVTAFYHCMAVSATP